MSRICHANAVFPPTCVKSIPPNCNDFPKRNEIVLASFAPHSCRTWFDTFGHGNVKRIRLQRIDTFCGLSCVRGPSLSSFATIILHSCSLCMFLVQSSTHTPDVVIDADHVSLWTSALRPVIWIASLGITALCASTVDIHQFTVA